MFRCANFAFLGMILSFYACSPASHESNDAPSKLAGEEKCSQSNFLDLDLSCQIAIISKLDSNEVLKFARFVAKSTSSVGWQAFVAQAKERVPESRKAAILAEVNAFRLRIGKLPVRGDHDAQFIERLIAEYLNYVRLHYKSHGDWRRARISIESVKPIAFGASLLVLISEQHKLTVYDMTALRFVASEPLPTGFQTQKLVSLGRHSFLVIGSGGELQAWTFGGGTITKLMETNINGARLIPVKGREAFFILRDDSLFRYVLVDGSISVQKWPFSEKVDAVVAPNENRLLSLLKNNEGTELVSWSLGSPLLKRQKINLEGSHSSLEALDNRLAGFVLATEEQYRFVIYDLSLERIVKSISDVGKVEEAQFSYLGDRRIALKKGVISYLDSPGARLLRESRLMIYEGFDLVFLRYMYPIPSSIGKDYMATLRNECSYYAVDLWSKDKFETISEFHIKGIKHFKNLIGSDEGSFAAYNSDTIMVFSPWNVRP